VFAGRHGEIPADDCPDSGAENSGEPGPGAPQGGTNHSPEGTANGDALQPDNALNDNPNDAERRQCDRGGDHGPKCTAECQSQFRRKFSGLGSQPDRFIHW
jgi:hypothetical protein